jgi:hypothetical protein
MLRPVPDDLFVRALPSLSADAFWKKLQETGWLEGTPPPRRAEFRQRLDALLAEGRPELAAQCLALLHLRVPAYDADREPEPGHYTRLVQQLAAFTEGQWQPAQLQEEPLDEGLVWLRFDSGGQRFRAVLVAAGPGEADPNLFWLVNIALREAGVDRRFVRLLTVEYEDTQPMAVGFTRGEVYAQAEKLGVVPFYSNLPTPFFPLPKLIPGAPGYGFHEDLIFFLQAQEGLREAIHSGFPGDRYYEGIDGLTFEAYWQRLEATGWFTGAPHRREATREHLREAFRDPVERHRVHHALWQEEFDYDSFDLPYRQVLEELETLSGGRFRPKSIQEKAKKREEAIALTFEHGGKRYSTTVAADGMFDKQVLWIANQALADAGEPCRFAKIPPGAMPDGIIRLAFTTPEAYGKAVAEGLLPHAPQYDVFQEEPTDIAD